MTLKKNNKNKIDLNYEIWYYIPYVCGVILT